MSFEIEGDCHMLAVLFGMIIEKIVPEYIDK